MAIYVAFLGPFLILGAFQLHTAPQTPCGSMALNQVLPWRRPCHRWREKNLCDVPSTHNRSVHCTVYGSDVLCHTNRYCLGPCQAVFGEVCSALEDEQPDEFSSFMTNSSGTVIGGSCGGVFVFCVLFYFLYRLLRTETSAVSPQPEVVANQNGAVCTRCHAHNPPNSPPPAYDDSCSAPPIAWEDCICMSKSAEHMPCPCN